jgi:STE24 endopeptidase
MGHRWHVTGLRDNGAFPVVWGLLTFRGFLALPVSNSITRQQEAEADMFGINASQQPLGLAEFMIRDADARQLDPSPVVKRGSSTIRARETESSPPCGGARST